MVAHTVHGVATAAQGAQARWARALLDPERDHPAGLRCWNGSDTAPRFAVHRNNIVVSLVDALAEQFPVCQELVGETFFRAMARVFVQRHPPRTPIVAFAGADLPAFIAAFPPAVSVPYLADMARLEMARIRACHAADAGTLAADAIGSAIAEPDRLAQCRFALHPSVQLLSSPHAIHALWAAHQGAIDIGRVDPDVAEQVLVFRDGLDVQTLRVGAGDFAFLCALQRGAMLAHAAEAAADAHADTDLAGAIALLLRHPLVTQLDTSP